MNIFIIWLVMVIAWNFGYPEASPLEDVVVAVILSLFNLYFCPVNGFWFLMRMRFLGLTRMLTACFRFGSLHGDLICFLFIAFL